MGVEVRGKGADWTALRLPVVLPPPPPSNMLNLALICCDSSPFFRLTLGLPNWPLFILCRGGVLCSDDTLLETASWVDVVVAGSETFLLLFTLLVSGSSMTLSKLCSKSSFSCFMSILGRVSFSLLSRRLRLGLGNPLLPSLLVECTKEGRCRGLGAVFRRLTCSCSGLMYYKGKSRSLRFKFDMYCAYSIYTMITKLIFMVEL